MVSLSSSAARRVGPTFFNFKKTSQTCGNTQRNRLIWMPGMMEVAVKIKKECYDIFMISDNKDNPFVFISVIVPSFKPLRNTYFYRKASFTSFVITHLVMFLLCFYLDCVYYFISFCKALCNFVLKSAIQYYYIVDCVSF